MAQKIQGASRDSRRFAMAKYEVSGRSAGETRCDTSDDIIQRQRRRGACNYRFALLAIVLLSSLEVSRGAKDGFHTRRTNDFEQRAHFFEGETWSKRSNMRTERETRKPIAKRLGQWIRSALPKWYHGDNDDSSMAPPSSYATRQATQADTLPSHNQQNTQEVEESDEDIFENYESGFLEGAPAEKPMVPAIAAAVSSLMSDPDRLGRWSMKAASWCMLFYLAKSVWKALAEAMEELSQELSSTGDAYFCSRTELPRILAWLENPSQAVLPRAALELARDLHLAGLPIRTSSSSGRTSIESLFQDLTSNEASILQQCLWRPPASVRQRPGALWENVLGLDGVKERLLLTIAAATDMNGSVNGTDKKNILQRTQEAYAPLLSGASAAPTSTNQHHGILLYGEPGCGKSFLVQALASKLQSPCMVVTPSVLMRKYVGETNLQVRALFSLTKKLSPCIVVLDELDGLFRERHDNEHDASRELKTEFLQWLSGIMTTSGGPASSSSDIANGSRPSKQPLVVVGATNRPFDVDSAILRRLPQRYYIGPPNYVARCQLIERMLRGIPLAGGFRIDYLAQQTEGYTPSDIQQVLQMAARTGPIKEAIMQKQREGFQAVLMDPDLMDLPPHGPVRSLNMQDVLNALSYVHATPLSLQYRNSLRAFTRKNGGNGFQTAPQTQIKFPPGNPWGLHVVNMGTLQVSSFDESRDDSVASMRYFPGEGSQQGGNGVDDVNFEDPHQTPLSDFEDDDDDLYDDEDDFDDDFEL